MQISTVRMKLITLFMCACIVFLSIYGSSDAALAQGTADKTFSMDNMDTIGFKEDPSVFNNPERGWYRCFSTDDIWGLDNLKSKGITVIMLEANLKDFLTKPISAAKLKEIRDAFSMARKYGLEVIFRAAYDFDGKKSCEPKSLSIIKGHIAQLKSIFYDNEDILYCVQAGFLGPWGEWHNSYYGNPPSLAARKTVLFALMDAVPKSRAILVRRPMFIRDIFAGEPGGNVLTDSTAFSGSALSRTGYHDDALLSTADEYGTYVQPGYDRQAELAWLNKQEKYVPFVAESDYLSSLSNPDNAVKELGMLHAQLVNIDYYPAVIQKWKKSVYSGTSFYNYLSARLGYRFLLLGGKMNREIKQGGVLHLTLSLKNIGLGNLSNARNVEFILSNQKTSYTAKVNEDPRKWYRENGAITKDFYFSIPSSAAPGSWSLYINLPSASTSLSGNPAYSIRLANAGTWVAAKGYNLVRSGIQIASSPKGSAVSTFRQITRAEAELLDR